MTYPIPRDARDDRLAIVGTAGSGKTYAAGTAVERILKEGHRAVIVDPLGVWYGLRLNADGATASPFNAVIFGGPHGDLPITESAGALIGEAVAGTTESCILDLSQLGTKAAERRFMLGFLTALYRKTGGDLVHLIFDEADMFAPQQLIDKEGDAAKLLGMMETIVRRGRIKGFIPWLITQRPAVLSKNVLSQADGLIAFKLTSSQDRDAIGDWVQGQADKAQWKQMWGSLATMQQGQGLVWIPGRSILSTVQFPAKITFDSSRAPKRGEKRRETALKPLDLGRLKDKLATVEAETKANDPRTLKAEIAKLKSEMQKLSVAKTDDNRPDPKEIEEAEKRGANIAKEAIARAIMGIEADIVSVINQAQEKLGRAQELMQVFSSAINKPLTLARVVHRPVQPNPKLVPISQPAVKFDGEGSFTGPQRRILTSLAFWHRVGHLAPSREQVALVAGYSPRGSAFTNPLGALKSAGHIDYPSPGTVRALAASSDGAMDANEARAILLNVLGGPQQRIVEAARKGNASREKIAERAGYSPDGSAFTNPLGSLRTIGLIEYPSPGQVALTDWAAELLG